LHKTEKKAKSTQRQQLEAEEDRLRRTKHTPRIIQYPQKHISASDLEELNRQHHRIIAGAHRAPEQHPNKRSSAGASRVALVMSAIVQAFEQ
jgi:hypothetical protein